MLETTCTGILLHWLVKELTIYKIKEFAGIKVTVTLLRKFFITHLKTLMQATADEKKPV